LPENSLTIRKITKGDNAALAWLIRQVFEEYDFPWEGTVYTDPSTDQLYELFQTPHSLLLVAEENGNLLGSCGIFPTENLPKGHAELVKLYLSKKARGKGIASELYKKCEEASKALGYTHLYLECFSHFQDALKLYEKYGYTYLKERLGNSGHFGCGIWMVKNIVV
jgi:putative acetyltransferase